MRLALLSLFLSIPGLAQFSVTISPQNGAIPAQYLGRPLPKGLVIALANTCNAGTQTSSVYVDRIAQAVATVAAVQDGNAAKYAAESVKANSFKVFGLALFEDGLLLLPGFGIARATTIVGKALASGGGAVIIAQRVKDRRTELATLSLPANWWTPNPTLTSTLQPGQCYPILLALDGKPTSREVTIPFGPPQAAAVLDKPALMSLSDPLAEVRTALETNPSPEAELRYREALKTIGAQQ